MEEIKKAQEKEYFAEHPEEADEETSLDDNIEMWKEELDEMKENWKPEKEPNVEKELALIKKWVKDRKNMRDR